MNKRVVKNEKSKQVNVLIPASPPIRLKVRIYKRKDGLYMARKQIAGQRFTGYGSSESEAIDKFINAYAQPRPDKRTEVLEHINGSNDKQLIKFGDWLTIWVEKHLRIGNKPITASSYAGAINNNIKPWIGEIFINELRESDLQYMCTKIRSSRSQATTERALFICRSALTVAVNEGLLEKHPVSTLSVKRKLTKERTALSPEEARVFLEYAKKHRQYCAFLLLIACGLRRNELLGLKWLDIHLDDGYLQIVRGLFKLPKATDGHSVEFSAPKTDTSVRTIPLPDWLIVELKLHQSRQETQYKKLKIKNPLGLVFCRRDGNPFYPDYISRLFTALLTSAGIRKVKLHDLRRTCATLALNSGATPRTVAELLGHASTRMVNEVYTVSSQGDKDRAVNAVISAIHSTPSHSQVESML